MRCEVVAVGTELLLGQVVDTNSSWIGGQMALAGIDSYYQTKVGDNQVRMVETIRLALSRADAVITCGGLGPTQDDITREAIAEIMSVPLLRDEAMAEHIRNLFASRGRPMAANNLRQADMPEGASAIPQMPGTAPGLICPVGDKVIYAVPGVPFEMRLMMEGTILPDLRRRAGTTAVIRSRVVRTWGQTESGLAEILAERIAELDRLGSPTLAFQASGIEGIKVRITAKAADEAAAEAVLAEEETRLRDMLGPIIFGTDDETMESVVIGAMREKGLTLAVAEGVTGGIAGTRLALVPGADDVLRGTVVSPLEGEPPLGLPAAQPTPEAASAMAVAVRETLDADIGLATTGIFERDHPSGERPGTVYLGLARERGTESRLVRLPGDRDRVRQYAVISVLDFLRQQL
ncbi:MAG: CinA family nicotinamide mononucleotide deamidase-related protein [Alphaproteobacteria bacterium]|jgi:nicotinamide-nucleotide amidase|nr:CinA family nicotinamide mononucleotide deamidase-related protein [Alphaproteobacteria bacterium]MDP6237765.1 CinA family nicotinamide mononucleotide deamidase-related protein [Alphaproteobacteria bacterium]MDP7173679.1 CinA family nicotinamide mononucleotide deamidase-related protein [Alphaproteobacteria bacterium]MDP7488147.1 CinA family nicotinamide mononucleotide deamidase-related protein [Alphaproteobacteria bacterium]HJN21591.1 CinA family nicotinamide mononucleotide deamidase-related 